MAEKIVAVKGMNDILPPESARWEWFEDTVRALMRRYAYQNVRTPIVEHTPLFVRGLGEVTDIVEKEMYSFVDSMNGDPLSLRPEGTAGVVRAVVEHSALYDGGKRLFYIGPMFRHERPQRGRYRQFHQVGVEALGFGGPDVDAEVILMCRALWKDLGLGEVRLDINSLGQPEERKAHRAALIAHFEQHAELLDEDARRRLHSNPLRILDTKNPAMQAMVEAAPQLIDYLGEASLKHFDALKAMLDAAGQPYRVNPRLVRGMDYYNLTVFEWVTDKLGAQGTICGGGRYDGLVELVGGKPAPGIGWGMGIERVLDLVQQLGVAPPAPVPDAYAIVPDGSALPQAMRVVEALRAAGVAVQLHVGGGSMKSQFKKADASGARHALIFGGDELARGEVAVKPLRDAAAAQAARPIADPATWAADLLPA
ncbi:histidine--tRNA ligase [Rubrivivax gelatinosus]|uniref:Histidine--tRNA ligase n=1 Tax=Rubrivivax gelatinosus (strain NBRC 100245 / IL144) TaxID=983917 RepID=I0HSV7_RUBGI|nr:histidine--tRNA ligase [Rubrivivax gelatinosus]MBG6082624.1 histidyl-tRNA synthetase [Rubrivivax gelatinosus]BAL96094.1 histidyl-tRNA synthetase HisS [Rubrivivax gelatinosus IL144]